MLTTNSKIYIAGHNGMVGDACLKTFQKNGFKNIITRSSDELDLRNQKSVNNFIKYQQPEIIINAAAKVGGILANSSYPYEFLLDNMMIQNNLIQAAHKNGVQKFIFLGSSCIYPKYAQQPIKEEFLLTGSLEPTNEWYAIAKISGVKLIEALRKQYNRDYLSLMPTNLYGPNDNFDLETSHVLPSLIRKFHIAKTTNSSTVTLWGTGSPLREFLHVKDLSEAVLFCTKNRLNHSIYNIGYGEDISISELASLVKNVIGFKGEIVWDDKKPNGTPKKLMDSSKINSKGWSPKIKLKDGIIDTYNWFLANEETFKEVKFESRK